MIPSQLVPLANHLWQSTLFAAVVGLLTLLLRANRAQVRYWLWLSASAKMLIPFSILVAVGGLIGRHTAATPKPSAPVSAAEFSFVVEDVGAPFTIAGPPLTAPTIQHSYAKVIVPVFAFVWTIGFVGLLLRWILRWRRVDAAISTATPLDLPIGIRVKSSLAFGEPGVFGILKPVLVLPDGIMDRLTTQELEAILAHEICHVKRRDNLANAIHLAVEALLWFYPLVWWLGARLIEERERACDEEVLQGGAKPRITPKASSRFASYI
jgi:beta-lactamase regulating signal transducer with metallopeptidase domain